MTRYLVEIAASHVPDSLVGAPLAIELFSQEGRARRAVLELSGDPLRYEVTKAGRYLVRTILPSGRVISSVAEMPETADVNDEVIAKTVLNLEETDAPTDFWRDARSFAQIVAQIKENVRAGEPVPAWFSAWAGGFFTRVKSRLGELAANAISSLVSVVLKTSTTEVVIAERGTTDTPIGRTSTEKRATGPVLTFECGKFKEWRDDQHASNPTIKLTLLASGRCGEDGTVWAPPAAEARGPLYLRITNPTKSFSSLMIWKPGARRGPARLSLNTRTVGYRSGSVLGATPDPEDPVTTMLFQYVRNGAFEEARLGLDTLVGQLENAPQSADPNRDILAGYVLYKLRHSYADILIPRLCSTLPDFSDCHILNCAQMIAAGKNDDALGPLTEAIAHGVPIYTEGIRLLRDSANFFRDIRPDDEQIGQQVRKARILAAAANLDSTLTCLRLGLDLSTEW
ncbi:hypothetical protein XH81_03995 [Bradyrhizobium sp. CCBAU 25360]|uniref:hypothetical protein n=1 Tax=Bradyrhizobium sp. CCBAU 25360 TaxID=858425 RepID=UPI0023050330|nr:hypothetical protein [Bradyrhizobium sp. CCBAU 25360]MDA9414031.1 hypothetical protein [Bradyrhizobium sp. CCBAU 25360]